jgi:formate-dependent nitrite reductase membrane component NrfD
MSDNTILASGGRQPPVPCENRGLMPPARPAPEEHAYYNLPMLKKPVWGGEVAAYFFLGGLSAGAYVLARMAERFGGERYRSVTRAGSAIAALTVLPCAPLLIADLGDPKRFHHMLRVFKPRSPMNLGAWTLTAYSGAAALAALREWLRDERTDAERSTAAKIVDGTLLLICDAAGVPLALLLAGYTGVLLSATSAPVWSKNPWLGALFSASAVSTGASAIGLALSAQDATHEAMKDIHTTAHLAEALLLSGFLSVAGPLAKPLTQGEQAPWFHTAAWGVLFSEVLQALPLRGRARRWASVASSLVGLASGFALRWSLVHAGRSSAADPEAARNASRR